MTKCATVLPYAAVTNVVIGLRTRLLQSNTVFFTRVDVGMAITMSTCMPVRKWVIWEQEFGV